MRMRQVINGKVYDTETATLIDSYNWGHSSDFDQISESLFVTKRGSYFVAGSGGPKTQYAVSVGQNSWGGSERIIPLNKDEALAWAEQHSDANTIAEFFEIEEA